MDASSRIESALSGLQKTFRSIPTEPWKSRLYLVTLLLQLPAAFARGLLGYATVGIAGWFIDLPIGPTFTAWAVGLAPLAWSLSAFWIPGGGWWWHRYNGANEPSEIELKRIRDAIEHLGSRAEDAAEYLRVYVYPSQTYLSLARGRVLLVSHGLLESKFLKAALAHELGHFRSMDARLVQALDRLVWGPPFPPLDEKEAREAYVPLLVTCWRWFLHIAGGQPLFRLVRPFWAAYFREREEAADAYAAELGQDKALARFLRAYELQLEQPNPRLFFNYREHIPVSHRIAALEQMSAPKPKPKPQARKTD